MRVTKGLIKETEESRMITGLIKDRIKLEKQNKKLKRLLRKYHLKGSWSLTVNELKYIERL